MEKAPVRTPAHLPPQWVTDLVDRACAFLDTDQRPTVVWHTNAEPVPAALDSPRKRTQPIDGVRYPTDYMSAGWTHKHPPYNPTDGVIEIYAGRMRQDQRLVVLHETAHWYLPRHHHSPKFWALAWRLYLKFMPRSLDYVLGREAIYMTGALTAAVAAGIVDATAARNNPHLRRAVPLKTLKENK